MKSGYIFLDGAQGLIIVPFFLLLHIVLTLFIEGSMLYAFKYNTYRKSLYNAFLANICSLIVGLVLISPFFNLATKITGEEKPGHLAVLLGIYYMQTIITEGLVLWQLNKTFPVKKLIPVCLLMNLVTYIILYFILKEN